MRLLLIEDDDAYRLAMASHLRQLAGVREVLVAGDGEQGLELMAAVGTDLVLLDLVLPGLGGLETCRRISAGIGLPVLILTSQEDPHWVQQIWQAGARGYLHKGQAFEQVELAITSLRAGASWWDHKATTILQAGSRPPLTAKEAGSAATLLDTLTSREREVLAQLAAGLGNRAIAQRLGIGEGTVRSHVHLVLQKLRVSNRTQAALLWLSTQPQGSDPPVREWPGQG
ncbi:response regulator transcription factor [Cyanobium sp. FGCU-52]|nr:response regulator transcription factor [Cyanobium sp. FGCU52]